MSKCVDIIVPCHNEEPMLPVTLATLVDVLDNLVATDRVDPASRIIFVDDGSRDATWSMIVAAHERDPRIRGVKLAHNAGQQAAMLAGMAATKADATITIDADLQDDVRVIPKMVDLFLGGAEIVYGVREERSSDTPFKRWSATFFYSLMGWLGVDTIPQHSDFRLMGRRAMDALSEFREVNLFIRGLVVLLGFPTARVYYPRLPRRAGETKYPLRRMIAFAMDGITSFSSVPLKLISRAGGFICGMSLLFGVWAMVSRFVGMSVPGWASTVVPIYFLGGVQMLSLGIIGEYMAKIYLETKQRPRFIVETVL